MSEACTHDCSNCHADCSSRAPQHEPPHAKSHIKKVIGVVSGKGGVGKTTTCGNLGIGLARCGKKVLLIDADPQGDLTASLGFINPDEINHNGL